ncbi:MAG TPA: RagB/SusD family nutrient uptake outer membrane protein [Gemmatimonadaceae bacterium]|nr:RagB/SusD family nutrient uptake outer membrane protein [Gemmatimonadaceae bacterium]
MHRTARKMLAALLVLVAAPACTDLTSPPKSSVAATNIWDDTGSYRAYIAKIYGGLQVSGQQGPAGDGDIQGIDEGFSGYIRLLWQMEELPTDEAAIAWNDAGVQELNTQLWSSSNQFLGAMYYRIYFQVGLVNEFLRQTTDDKLTARNVSDDLRAQIHQYRAEARFLRALSYWHGIDLFGSIPLVTEDFPLGITPPKQNTRAELFSYVVAQLDSIRPDLPQAGQGEYGRADQGAVDMLLAKLYLNAQVYVGEDHYADARAAVERVITSGAYQLDPDYMHNFLADNNTSREIIFAVPFDGTHSQSYGGTTFLTHAEVGGNMPASAYGLDGGWWGLRLRPEVAELYPGGPGGPDHRASFIFTNGQSETISSLTDFSQGWAAPKYQNVTSTGAPGSNTGFADVDYPMFRLADAYLMYAEAVLRGGGGDLSTALGYVNQLRERAYGDASGDITASQLTLDFILDERARELLWEGHRRTDLIRFDRFTKNGVWAWKGNVEAGAETQEFRNLYPLPASELVANPNLTQNPGY